MSWQKSARARPWRPRPPFERDHAAQLIEHWLAPITHRAQRNRRKPIADEPRSRLDAIRQAFGLRSAREPRWLTPGRNSPYDANRNRHQLSNVGRAARRKFRRRRSDIHEVRLQLEITQRARNKGGAIRIRTDPQRNGTLAPLRINGQPPNVNEIPQKKQIFQLVRGRIQTPGGRATQNKLGYGRPLAAPPLRRPQALRHLLRLKWQCRQSS